MSAEDEKDPKDEAPAKPATAKKPAAKKAAAKKPAAKKDAVAEDEGGPDGQLATLKAPAKSKRAAKKAVESKVAAPGDGEEAKQAAKAQDAAKPSKKLARGVSASVKATPSRRVVRAHARYVRTSARKARMVCGHLRGKSIEEARAILAFTPREVARDWSKLLESRATSRGVKARIARASSIDLPRRCPHTIRAL